MEFYEIRAIMKYQYLAYKEQWEQARLVAYVTACANSTKKSKLKKPTDLITFSWEEGNKTTTQRTGNTSMSNEDLERLRKRAELYMNTQTI